MNIRLRLRRGMVWYPRRCIRCGWLHLNGRRVSLPMCVPCFDDWQAGDHNPLRDTARASASTRNQGR